MSCLYLCEKPSQARDIARILGVQRKGEGCLLGEVAGRRTIVTWCYGHLLEMAPPDSYDPALKRWSLASLPIVPSAWRLTVKASASSQFTIVQALLKESSEVIIATDADREGELIAREVLTLSRWRGSVQRLWLSALDDASIRKALTSLLPGAKTEPLWQAGLGRARADWLVGMNLTRAYTVAGQSAGYSGVLSVGRVQTPTLALIVLRDRAIESFVPLVYFDVTALFQLAARPESFRASWVPPSEVADEEGRCLDQKAAAQVVARVTGQSGAISKAETRRFKESPPLPFDLSTLQQIASLRYGLGAQQVLDAAQSLYETHKAVTYPRTDCPYLPESQFSAAPAILAALAASDRKPDFVALVTEADPKLHSRAWDDAKITAHHAIIPTAARVEVGRMSLPEAQVYDLIRRRYLAQFYPDYEYDRTDLEVLVEQALFRTSGRVMRVLGWRAVLGGEAPTEGEGTEALLPAVSVGEAAEAREVSLEEKKTRPLPRYTEGTLIAAMKNVGRSVADPALKKVLKETAGIGTEATRANIIETLLKRGFLVREKRRNLVSTPAGRALVDALPDAVKNPATTALWEQGLDEIARGEAPLAPFLERQARWVGEIVATVKTGQMPSGLAALAKTAAPTPSQDPTPPARPRRTSATTRAKPPTEGGAPAPAAAPAKVRTKRATKAAPETDTPPTKPPAKKAARVAPADPSRPIKIFRLREEPTPAAATNPTPPTAERPAEEAATCPLCQGKLVQRMARQGPYAGQTFRGCANFPRCRYTANG